MENFKLFNAHPKGKRVGDCVKRAITVAEGRDYNEVKRDLNRLKRSLNAKAFNQKKVWKRYMKNNNYEILKFPAEKGKPRMNGDRFTRAYPKGTYILSMAKHLSVSVDGVIYDTFDCREKCVYQAFKVK